MCTGAVRFAAAIGVGLALCVPTAGFAQWMWKDDAGHTVVSDQPPPTTVPESRILKTPSGHNMSAPPPASDANKTKSLAEQDLEFKKRQKELADASKKQQDDAAKNEAIQQHCQAMRANLTTLQSGQRIARTDDSGQRYFVDDSQRQAETQKAQADLAENCK